MNKSFISQNNSQRGIAILFIPLLIIMLGFVIAAPLFVFSIVKSLSVSNVYQYLFSGDAAGVSYTNGAPIINPNVKVTQCTALPIDPNKITSFNSTLHGSSVFKPRFDDGHNTFMGYDCQAKGTQCGDAVDLNAPAGTPAYAPFAGSCTNTEKNRGTSFENAVIVSTDGKMKSTLAHIKVTCGSNVQAGQQIGVVSNLLKAPHIHFELWINNQPVASHSPGKSLWDLMQKILTQQKCK